MLAALELVFTELELSELVLEGDYFRRVLGLVVVEQDANGLLEVTLTSAVDRMMLGLVVGKPLSGY